MRTKSNNFHLKRLEDKEIIIEEIYKYPKDNRIFIRTTDGKENDSVYKSPKIEKTDSRILSIAGLITPPGHFIFLPFNFPPVILIKSPNFYLMTNILHHESNYHFLLHNQKLFFPL